MSEVEYERPISVEPQKENTARGWITAEKASEIHLCGLLLSCGVLRLGRQSAPEKDRRMETTLAQAWGEREAFFHAQPCSNHEGRKPASTGEWGQKNRAILLSSFFCRLDRASSLNMPKAFSVDLVTQSNARRKPRESWDNRRDELEWVFSAVILPLAVFDSGFRTP